MISVPFVILRARPDDFRGECINVGLVAFFQEATHVYFDVSAARLRALHPDFEHIDTEKWTAELESWLCTLGDWRSQMQWLRRGMGAITGDPVESHIQGEDKQSILSTIEDMLERLVHAPERTLASPVREVGTHKNKLQSELRSWFRASKVFSPKVADLSNNRVVPWYPIDVTDDLYADFALKNGAVHVIEVLDLRGVERVTRSIRGDAGLTAILLDQAKRILSSDSRRIAITAADDYSLVRPLVSILGRYASEVVAIESSSDRRRFVDFIATTLNVEGPLATPLAAGAH